MTNEEAKEYIYDCLDHSEATEVIKALEQQPCEDCISREQAKRFLYERINRLNDDELYDIFSVIIDDMYNELPSVTPTIPEVEDNFDIGYNCGYADAMCDIGGES